MVLLNVILGVVTFNVRGRIVTSDLLPVRRNIMVREAYFDAPNLGRLIQDVWNNPGFVSPGASK